jgi:hypothetical protein
VPVRVEPRIPAPFLNQLRGTCSLSLFESCARTAVARNSILRTGALKGSRGDGLPNTRHSTSSMRADQFRPARGRDAVQQHAKRAGDGFAISSSIRRK